MKRQIIIEFDDEEQMKCPNGPDGEPGVLSINIDEVSKIYKNCYNITKQLSYLFPHDNFIGPILINRESLIKRLNEIQECVHNISSTMHDVEERNRT